MDVFSNSRLDCFDQCPRKHWFAYIGKPKIEVVENIEAFHGSRVHDALEYLYAEVQQGRVPSEADLLASFDAEWDRQWTDSIRIVNPERTPGTCRALGRDELSGYYRQHVPFDDAETIALEYKVWIDLGRSGRYRLVGYIDRLARRADGVYGIHDYKSSNYRPTQADADEDRQLALYQIGVQQAFADAHEVELVWHYLRHGIEIRSRRSAKQLAVLKRDCMATVDTITALGPEEAESETRPSPLCRWCEYQTLCPAFLRPAGARRE